MNPARSPTGDRGRACGTKRHIQRARGREDRSRDGMGRPADGQADKDSEPEADRQA